MKIVFFTILVIFSTQRQSNAGVVRKPPAFATPVYSNSYLPAAMQVIFHAVDQLKHLEAEETVSTSPTTTIALPTTSPHAPGQHQPSAEEVSIQSTESAAYEPSTASIAYMASTASELSISVTVSEVSSDSSASEVATEASASEVVTEASVPQSSIDSVASDASSDTVASDASVTSSTESVASDASVTSSTASDAPATSDASIASFAVSETSAASTAPEVVADSAASQVSATSTVSEDSTASIAAINPTGSTPTFRDIIDNSQSPTPVPENAGEINEEKPEIIEEVTVADESKAETPEENYATPEINHEVQEIGQEESESNQEIPEKNESDEPIPSLSTSSEVVESSATTALPKAEDKNDSSEEDKGEKSSEESKEKSDESESESSSESKSDEDESSEEEDDEIRFTLIGEKVSQVPRPSLSNYLRKTARGPLRGSVQDLATLYDALSKDARKQGLGKYAGYSDEVLQTLESSIEGGVGPQLRILLEKAQERNELTRDDAKKKLSVALKKLADPASILSRDLRRLIPLRYIP